MPYMSISREDLSLLKYHSQYRKILIGEYFVENIPFLFLLLKIRNVKVGLQKISFSFDIILQNPTNEDFSVSSGGAIKAKGYQLVRGDKVLVMGHFSKEFQNIDLPAYQSYTIENGAEIGRASCRERV